MNWSKKSIFAVLMSSLVIPIVFIVLFYEAMYRFDVPFPGYALSHMYGYSVALIALVLSFSFFYKIGWLE